MNIHDNGSDGIVKYEWHRQNRSVVEGRKEGREMEDEEEKWVEGKGRKGRKRGEEEEEKEIEDGGGRKKGSRRERSGGKEKGVEIRE